MKVQKNFNELVFHVKLGKITAKEALDIIVSDMQENPFLYGLHQFDEEFRSDIILKILQKGTKIFDLYNPKNGQFKTYLCSLIKYQAKDILREKYKKELNEKHLSAMSILNYEADTEKYASCERELSLSDFKPFTPSEKEKVPYKDTHTLQSYIMQKKQNELSCIKMMGKYGKKNQIKKTALVLALKSCSYITDEYIDSLSSFCGIPKETVIRLIEEVKDTLEEKNRKISRIQKSRDREFLLKRHIEEELNSNNRNDRTIELERFYDLHKKHWEIRNNELQNRKYLPSPTNKKVAEVLGICERQVGNYLQHADEVIEEFLEKQKDSDL